MPAIAAVLLTAAAALGGPADEPCRCADTWDDSSGACASNPKTRHGCPTVEELRECDPDGTLTPTQFRWCKTTQASCADQGPPDSDFSLGRSKMNYCDVQNTQAREAIRLMFKANTDPAGRCVTVRSNNGTTEVYDINILKKSGGGTIYTDNYHTSKINREGHDDQDYYINVCGGLVGGASLGDQYTTDDGIVAAYESMLSNQNQTHVLARYGRSTNLTVVKDNDLRLSMGGGAGSDNNDPNCPERQVDIVFFCSEVATCPGGGSTGGGDYGFPVFLDEFKKCEYVFVWNSCAACPIGSPARDQCSPVNAPQPKPGVTITVESPATVLLITIAVLFSAYLVIGFSYNRFVNGERGLNQIPNYEFWSSCFTNAAAAPGAIASMFIGKPKPNSVSQNFHAGLLEDDEDELELEDAEDHAYG